VQIGAFPLRCALLVTVGAKLRKKPKEAPVQLTHIGRSGRCEAQSDLICASQPVIAEKAPAVQNGGSVSGLLGLPLLLRVMSLSEQSEADLRVGPVRPVCSRSVSVVGPGCRRPRHANPNAAPVGVQRVVRNLDCRRWFQTSHRRLPVAPGPQLRRTLPHRERTGERIGRPGAHHAGGACRQRTARPRGRRGCGHCPGHPSPVREHAPVVPGCGYRASD
jgi:hypothetical protein